MKTARWFGFLFLLTLVITSCNSGPKNREASTDTEKSAALVENAKVEGEKSEGEPQSVEDFVKEAASGSLMEIELGRYAQQNATNNRVKNFGAMMVRDHSKASDELKSITAGKNIPLPAEMESKHSDKVVELKKESGTEFDKKYINEMVDDHEKDIDKFRKHSENGKEPEIREFASKTLPVLGMHLDSARSIRDALNR